MKFLKCLVAYKGRQYTSASNYNDDVNITQSWVMRPGDSFSFNVYNYQGTSKTTVNATNAQAATGDFFGRNNWPDGSAINPLASSTYAFSVFCIEQNGELALEFFGDGHAFLPMVSVLHGSTNGRVASLESLKYACTHNFDYGPYKPSVPDAQQMSVNGIIRYTTPFYHKTDIYGVDNARPALCYYNNLHYLGMENQISSMIDLDNKIKHFIETCGETQTGLSASTITSSYHLPTPRAYNTSSTNTLWCGGLYACPPRAVNAQGETYTFCKDVLSIITGTGWTDGYNYCVDEHNNICGWPVPQARAHQFNSSASVISDPAHIDYRVGRVGARTSDNTIKTFFTSFMEFAGIYTYNAYQQLQNAWNPNLTDYGGYGAIGMVPPLAIMSDRASYNNHLLNRWGTQSSSSVAPTYPINMFNQSKYPVLGCDGNAVTLRDIGDAANSYGTFGSYGIIISTFESATNDVNNATQIYAPIHCLITPSLISDWPALDIYGLSRRRVDLQDNLYEQGESCFEYSSRYYDLGTIPAGPAAGKPAGLSHIIIYKTAAMSNPNIWVQSIAPLPTM